MTKLEKAWLDFNLGLMMGEQDAYLQIRKMYQHQQLVIPWRVFKTGVDTCYTEMGYANPHSKEKQLTRNYFNEEELVEMRTKFLDRMAASGGKSHQSTISAKLGNVKKKNSSMGFCMQNITMNFLKDGCFSIDMNYRSTETLVKFFADLKYLHEVLFPFILEGSPVTPDKVVFNFSIVYFSMEFLPVLFQFVDAEETLRKLKKVDPRYFRRCLSIMKVHLDEGMVSGYQTRNKMHNVFWKYTIPDMTKKELKSLDKFVMTERDKK